MPESIIDGNDGNLRVRWVGNYMYNRNKTFRVYLLARISCPQCVKQMRARLGVFIEIFRWKKKRIVQTFRRVSCVT